MSDQQLQLLRQRIEQLESEVKAREEDLRYFRSQLNLAQTHLKGLSKKIQGQVEAVSFIHRLLVPTEVPQLPGFEVSTKFLASGLSGGDFFDLFEHEDKLRFGIWLSSSTGHAASALMMSAIIKFSGLLEARKSSLALTAAEPIFQEVKAKMDEGSELDAFYGIIDRRDYELSFVRLGRVYGFHQLASREINLLPSSGPNLTKVDPLNIQPHSVLMNAKDRLVLVSRGVIEAVDERGDRFGVDRITRAITETVDGDVHAVRHHILMSVDKFLSGKSAQRDCTVMVFEVKDKVIKLAR